MPLPKMPTNAPEAELKQGRRVRADLYLVDLGHARSRSRAQAMVKAGIVFADDKPVTKPSQMIAADTVLELRGEDHPWVSRGGLKLVHAITHFNLNPEGITAIDVGASTGGFTDVLLHHGAARVYAVDVGQDQLVDKLRDDQRVVVMEQTNARHLTREQIPDPVDWVVCDASFISLELVLPAAMALTGDNALLVALIKPQFEVGRGQLGKKGVVRDTDKQQQVCERIAAWLADQPGWQVEGMTPSPITGPEGNREFLILGRKVP